MTEKSLKDYALDYLKKGFSVIPVLENKKPAIVSWAEYQKRLPTKEEVEIFFSNEKVKGIGIITGTISGFFVLDIDRTEDVVGLELPLTPTVRTGNGGWHFWFKLPKDKKIENRIGFRYKMDIKGENGYVIVPPSLHQSGKRYEWYNQQDYKTELAEAPEWLLKEITNPKKSLKNLEEIFQGVPEGRRDISATEVCGKILRSLKVEEWKSIGWQMLKGWNESNEPPLEENQLIKVFNSISQRELRRREDELNFKLKEPISYKEFLEKEYPPVKWIIDKLVPYAGKTIISAPPEHYKTWLILFMAISIAKGENFLNFPTQKTNILFINEESWEGTIQERIKLITSEKDLPIFFYHNENIKVDDQSILKILDFCLKKDIKLVIIDSLRRIHIGDENSSKDIDKLFNFFSKLTQNEIALIITHHNRKEDFWKVGQINLEKMRGSSNIGAQIDCNLAIEKRENFLVLHQIKSRTDKKIEPIKFKLTENENFLKLEYLGEFDETTKKMEECYQALINFIGNNPGCSRKEINKVLLKNFSSKIIDSQLNNLEEKGEIFVKRNIKPYRFYKQEISIDNLF